MNNTMLSDRIEKFILELLGQQPSEEVLLKRKDVAEMLECAPSQITYVINTRFSPNQRFLVESRRGNGGYIKISLRSGGTHTAPSKSTEKPVSDAQAIENSLEGYYRMLMEYEIITEREYKFMCMMTHTMLEYCPEQSRRNAAKALIHRIEWALKGE